MSDVLWTEPKYGVTRAIVLEGFISLEVYYDEGGYKTRMSGYKVWRFKTLYPSYETAKAALELRYKALLEKVISHE